MTTFRIETVYSSGSALYTVLRGLVGGVLQVWNSTGTAWEVYNAAHWADYAVPLAEQAGSGYYAAVYPVAITGVLTTEVVYVQGGGAPAVGDPPLSFYHSQGGNVAAVAGSVQAALNLGAATGSQKTGTLVGTPTAIALQTDFTTVVDDQYIGRLLIMTSGVADKQVQYILAYNGTTKTISLAAPLVTVPAAADTFVIC